MLALVFALSLPWPGAVKAGEPAATPPSVRVVVIADINGSYGTVGYSSAVHAAVRRIVELRPDLVIGLGDLIAGQQSAPRLERDRLEAMWRAFDAEVLEPLAAARIPFIPVAGNHDAPAEPGFALERRVFEEQWRRHRPDVEYVSESGYPFRYAFVRGGVLLVVLDATRVGPLAPEQRDWVAGVLRDSAPSRARIVAGHLPIRPFTRGREAEILADAALEEVLRDRGVDLYLSGHHHAFYPGYGAGFLQVSQGCLGAGPRALIGEQRRSRRSFTLLEVGAADEIAIRALAEPDFTVAIDRASLPAAIRFHGMELLRDDLAAPTTGR